MAHEDHQRTAAMYANLVREHEMLKVQHVALHQDYLRAQAEASNYEQVIKNISRKWYEKLFNIKSK